MICKCELFKKCCKCKLFMNVIFIETITFQFMYNSKTISRHILIRLTKIEISCLITCKKFMQMNFYMPL